MGGVSVTESRSRAVFFSSVYYSTPVTFITPPSGLRPPIFLVFEPLSPLVWISIIIALMMVLFTQWLIVEKILKRKGLAKYWAIIAALMRQGNSNIFCIYYYSLVN